MHDAARRRASSWRRDSRRDVLPQNEEWSCERWVLDSTLNSTDVRPLIARPDSTLTRATRYALRSPGSKSNETMRRLLRAIEPTARGTKMTKDSRAEISGCLDELKALSAGQPVRQQQLNGTWRLVWTSEKEILAIIKEGGIASWFGTEAGDVLQVIDLANDRLQNCIEFPPEGAFLVDSFIQFDEEDQKCSFQFSGAALKTDKRTIKLPPMGKSRFRWVLDLDQRVLARSDSHTVTLSHSRYDVRASLVRQDALREPDPPGRL